MLIEVAGGDADLLEIVGRHAGALRGVVEGFVDEAQRDGVLHAGLEAAELADAVEADFSERPEAGVAGELGDGPVAGDFLEARRGERADLTGELTRFRDADREDERADVRRIG